MSDLMSEAISEICDSLSDNSDSNKSDETDGGNGNKNKLRVPISKEFQENVIKFVKLDDLMKKKQQEMGELREQKKPCEQFILKYLETINEEEVGITNGKLRKNKSETKAAMNQEALKLALTKKIADPKLVDEILKEMEEARPLNTKVSLARTSGNDKKAVKKKTIKKK